LTTIVRVRPLGVALRSRVRQAVRVVEEERFRQPAQDRGEALAARGVDDQLVEELVLALAVRQVARPSLERREPLRAREPALPLRRVPFWFLVASVVIFGPSLVGGRPSTVAN
jgi:hypothetical protein